MIDTHCHFDMMPSPERYIQERERRGDIVIGMTNAPSHFQMGYQYVQRFKHIRLALGFHPLLAHELQEELPLFEHLIDKTSYVGEIGLDFSREGVVTQEIQIKSLEGILAIVSGKNKIISVHSRNAEQQLLSLLKKYHIKNVIFHWYSGELSLVPDILDAGYYFSINEAMVSTLKGRKIIDKLPTDRILTETDSPFNRKDNLNNVYSYLGKLGCNEQIIYNNFKGLIANMQE